MKLSNDTYSIKKYIWRIVFTALFLIFLIPSSVYAQSSYVLPYPSFMPGNPLYRVNLVKEKILKYWYFGNFGQFDYNLKQSDKYLIEAKTLFEYRQFLLGYKALKKSDVYFKYLLSNLNAAKREDKNIDIKRKILKEAALKHIEILSDLKKEIPETFLWQPEKSQPTYLYLRKNIEHAISVRIKNS